MKQKYRKRPVEIEPIRENPMPELTPGNHYLLETEIPNGDKPPIVESLTGYYYYSPDADCYGFGFNTADGGGFLPLADMSKDTRIIPLKMKEVRYRAEGRDSSIFESYATDIPIYRGKFVLIVSNSPGLVKEKLPLLNDEEGLYAHAVLSNWDGAQGYVMVLNPRNGFSEITHGVIAHEAVHLANALLYERDVKTDAENDEAFAYLMEWMVDKVSEWLRLEKPFAETTLVG